MAVFLFLAGLIAFGAYRAHVAHQCAKIRELGGEVTTGPPPVYHDLAYTTRSPAVVRSACTSQVGQWVFEQFPVVYQIDLRAVRNPDDVKEALLVAKDFDHLGELTLYRSGVTDDHLAILCTGFPKLVRLKINETAITDRGIRHLRHLPLLEMVNAQRTSLTNAAVPDLAAIPRLKELMIANTGITSVKDIRDKHPTCRIRQRLVHKTRCPKCMQTLAYCTCKARSE